MSEAATMTRPDYQPRHKGAPEALQTSRLDELVGMDATLRQQFEAANGNLEGYDAFKNEWIDTKLAEQGLTPDEDDAKSVREFQFAKGTYLSIMDFRQAEWIGL